MGESHPQRTQNVSPHAAVGSRGAEGRRWLLSALAALPFLSLYVHHAAVVGRVPTGYFMADMPSYSANGRAIFERGNGIAYPNPWDSRADAPALYVHWPVWILGFGTVKLGFDPGVWFVAVGIAAALVCSRLTLALVETVLPGSRYRTWLYLLTMWGGGLLSLARIWTNLQAGRPWDDDLFCYDPCYGWWFLNWGRNLILSTEAIYHSVMAACWLAVLRDRWSWALALAALAVLMHPFTGLEALLILLAWAAVTWIEERNRTAFARVLVLSGLLALFLAYHQLFLERDPAHRVVRAQMSLPWTEPPISLLLADGVVATLAIGRLRWQRGRDAGLLVVAGLVVFGLVHHHLLMESRQPIHFDRGYLWLALSLLALPWLQRLAVTLHERCGPMTLAALGLGFSGVMVSDNASFLARCWAEPAFGMFLTSGERDMFTWIDEHHLRGEVLASEQQLSYLVAAYTSLRPHYGHPLNTPNYSLRYLEATEWFQTGARTSWLARVDYFLVRKAEADRTLHAVVRADGRAWRVLHETEDCTLIGYPALSAGAQDATATSDGGHSSDGRGP